MSNLDPITCGECGIEFALPSVFLAERREDKKTWYCPNGHARAFTKSTTERLQAELDSTRTRLREQLDDAWTYAHAEYEAKRAAQRSNASLRGQLTKLRRRTAAEAGESK